MGKFILFIVIVMIIYYALQSMLCTNPEEPKDVFIKDYKVSEIVDEKIANWEKIQMIKLRLEDDQVLVNPTMWNLANLEEKENVVKTLVLKNNYTKEKDAQPLELIDMQTGKKLASYSVFSNINIEP